MLVCTCVDSHPLLHVTRRVPNGTVVVVPGLWPMNHAMVSEVLYLCYWHSQESSPPCTRQPQDYIRNMACMHVCIYVYFANCVCPVICCYFLHALWASQIIPLTFDL